MKSDHRIEIKISLFLLILLAYTGIGDVFGHGTEYVVLSGGVVGVQASFDTGVPMADADVLIFAPNEITAAIKSRTDTRGIVCFAPDKAGAWVIQVRAEGGHGMRINLEVDQDSIVSVSDSEHSSLSILQKLFLAVCVCWGFIGTGLYFYGRKKRDGGDADGQSAREE
jgi:nickel transport protein